MNKVRKNKGVWGRGKDDVIRQLLGECLSLEGMLRSGLCAGSWSGAGGSKFGKLGEGQRSLTEVWSSQGSRCFIWIGQWVQIIQLIIYEAKNGNLEGWLQPSHR